jgi:hypothetical protein
LPEVTEELEGLEATDVVWDDVDLELDRGHVSPSDFKALFFALKCLATDIGSEAFDGATVRPGIRVKRIFFFFFAIT